MKKILFSFIIFLAPILVHAQAAAPENALWAAPATASPGASIELNAFIYNKENQDITYTVSFQDGAKQEVVQSSGLIPSQTAKTIVATWKQPQKPVTLTAVIVKAVTKQKKDIASLHGDVGTFTVGLPETKKAGVSLPSLNINTSKIKAFIGVYLQGLEVWRVKEADSFTQLRNDAREKTGITKVRQIVDVPNQDIPGTTVEKIEPPQTPSAMDYGKLILFTSLASLFMSKSLFYIVFVIVVLWLFKFILGRFI